MRSGGLVGDTQMTAAQLARLSGLHPSNIWVAARRGYGPNWERLQTAAAAGPDSVLLTHQHTTIPALARRIAACLDDPMFCVRLLKEPLEHALGLRREPDRQAFLLRPPATGSHAWDALVAGVADYIAGQINTACPSWCLAAGTYLPAPWSPIPLGALAARREVETPIELRERNVIMSRSNLYSVRTLLAR